jgi:hypothetical protein
VLAELEGQVIGLRAFMRWRFVAGGRFLRSVRAVDTVTHPDHQGKGVFSRLTRHAVEKLRGETDFIFNTPNPMSLPGYLKMGWQTVGVIPIWVRVRRPIAFARGLRSISSHEARPDREVSVGAPTADTMLATHSDDLPSFLEEVARFDERLSTPLSPEYLRWRYGRAPLDYRAVSATSSGRLEGICFFRVRPRGRLWEATVSEVLVRQGDHRTASRMLDRVASSAKLDHLTCHFPTGSTPLIAARRRRFVRAPKGELLAVNPLQPELNDFVCDLRSWAVSLGTLEVF